MRPPFVLPSTRAFLREAKDLPRYSLFDLVHGYVYGRWPFFYIAVATGEHPLARVLLPVYETIARLLRLIPERWLRRNGDGRPTFADGYHGKVVPLQEARRLVSVNREVTLPDLEHVIPYALARDIVLRNPDHIVVVECPCRSARKKPCLPLDVCLIVGEPFAGFILEHQPSRTRRITPAEAIEILQAEDARGHVHHAFFKDAMLGRFYAICNCCRCCCGAMQAHRNGTPMLASSGYVAKLDRELCVSCGTCAKYCQFDAVDFVDGIKVIDETKCMGCGVCIEKCAKHALSLVRDPARGVPLQIEEFMGPN